MRAKIVTYEERQLMAIYNPGTRRGLLKALIDMQQYLSKEERDLNDLTASAISKLQEMSDDEYEALDLVPDFDPEDE